MSEILSEKSIRVTVEHGHANHRSDDFYSVGYWYQTEHAPVSEAAGGRRADTEMFDPGGAAAPAPMPNG